MITCPTCNTQNETGAAFCDQCGANLAVAGGSADRVTPEAAATVNGGRCPACGASALNGDLFCGECGAALGDGLSLQEVPAAAAAPMASGPEVARILVANGQSILLAGRASYLIGREDPVSGIYPEVDTTASDGDVAGVSRRHAEIVQQSSQWFLQDLNSTNGTFVNNQRLAPQTRHPLQAGDQIRLGKWAATFQV